MEEVNYTTSRVLLLSDLNSKIPVLIEPEGVRAILSGGEDNLGEIKYQKEKLLISNESIVYSSGLGGILKAGIPIGKIKINNKKINVKFFKDFNQISFVKVLRFSEEKIKMANISKNNISLFFFKLVPVILLYISVLLQLDEDNKDYFNFDFAQILIFYWCLKRNDLLGYGFIFFAGIVNDTLVGLPLGITSFCYLILCGFAAYLRTITISPSLIKDWFFFLLAIFVTNSLSFIILYLFFDVELKMGKLFLNTSFTFLLYIIFSAIFDYFLKNFIELKND